jgi:hypothetical protein
MGETTHKKMILKFGFGSLFAFEYRQAVVILLHGK